MDIQGKEYCSAEAVKSFQFTKKLAFHTKSDPNSGLGSGYGIRMKNWIHTTVSNSNKVEAVDELMPELKREPFPKC